MRILQWGKVWKRKTPDWEGNCSPPTSVFYLVVFEMKRGSVWTIFNWTPTRRGCAFSPTPFYLRPTKSYVRERRVWGFLLKVGGSLSLSPDIRCKCSQTQLPIAVCHPLFVARSSVSRISTGETDQKELVALCRATYSISRHYNLPY